MTRELTLRLPAPLLEALRLEAHSEPDRTTNAFLVGLLQDRYSEQGAGARWAHLWSRLEAGRRESDERVMAEQAITSNSGAQ